LLILNPIKDNYNFFIRDFKMKLSQEDCPYCGSKEIKTLCFYSTKNNGQRPLRKCDQCEKTFSITRNTPLEGLRTNLNIIIKVIIARFEGMAFNATMRHAGHLILVPIHFLIGRNVFPVLKQHYCYMPFPISFYSKLLKVMNYTQRFVRISPRKSL